MKKLIFISNFSACGGVETIFLNYIKELKDIYQCQLISTSDMPENIATILNDYNIKYFVLHTQRQKGILNRIKYKIQKKYSRYQAIKLCHQSDVLIDFKNGCAQSLLKHSSSRLCPKQIMWIHGGLPFVEQYMNFDWNCYDTIVVLTDGLKQTLKEKYPSIAERFTRIYNPINCKKISQTSQQTPPLDYSYFLHVSRLDADKDLKTLIDAYEILYKKTHTSTKLCLIGDGSIRNELEQYCSALESNHNIIFLGKIDAPFHYMKYAKSVILSSVSEGLPCVLIEALSCTNGVVVSADCPNGPREILQNGKCGKLFPVKDANALAKILEDIDCNRINKSQFENNIPQSLKRFKMETVLKDIKHLLEQ